MNATLTSFGTALRTQFLGPLAQARQFLFRAPPDVNYDTNTVPENPLAKAAYNDTKISGVTQILSAAKTTILNLHEQRQSPIYKQLSDFAFWGCDHVASASSALTGESSLLSSGLKYVRDFFNATPDDAHRQDLYSVASLPEAGQNTVVSFRLFILIRDNWRALQASPQIIDETERWLFAKTASLNLGANIFSSAERIATLLPGAFTLGMAWKASGLPFLPGVEIGPEDQLLALSAALAFRFVNTIFFVAANHSQLKLSEYKNAQIKSNYPATQALDKAMADRAIKNLYFRLSTLFSQGFTIEEAFQRYFSGANAQARIADTLRVMSVNAKPPHVLIGLALFLLQGYGPYRNLLENLNDLEKGYETEDPVLTKAAHLGCCSALYQLGAALLTPFPYSNNLALLVARQAGRLNMQRQSLEQWHRNQTASKSSSAETSVPQTVEGFPQAK